MYYYHYYYKLVSFFKERGCISINNQSEYTHTHTQSHTMQYFISAELTVPMSFVLCNIFVNLFCCCYFFSTSVGEILFLCIFIIIFCVVIFMIKDLHYFISRFLFKARFSFFFVTNAQKFREGCRLTGES